MTDVDGEVLQLPSWDACDISSFSFGHLDIAVTRQPCVLSYILDKVILNFKEVCNDMFTIKLVFESGVDDSQQESEEDCKAADAEEDSVARRHQEVGQNEAYVRDVVAPVDKSRRV